MAKNISKAQIVDFSNDFIEAVEHVNNKQSKTIEIFLDYCTDLLNLPKFDCTVKQLEKYLRTAIKQDINTIEFYEASNELLRLEYKEVINM